MPDIRSLFRPDDSNFTIFVVEQRFVIGRGHDFFQSYINTPNYFDSDEKVKNNCKKVMNRIGKSVAPVAHLVSSFTHLPDLANIAEIVTSLCKLFTVHEHQAAGPEVIDPILIQEGRITKHALARLIHQNKDSILCPSIIIMLKDNDFDRIKELLSECPNGINAKMIRNSGEEEIYKVFNSGAEDIDSFIDSFAGQCFSTCSQTRREVLLNSTWSRNLIISKYGPRMFRIRTNLLFDQKEEIKAELSDLIHEIDLSENSTERDMHLLRSIECVAKLFRVFCNDYGGQDIIDAMSIAKSLNSEVLLAQVYRYAELLPNCSEERKNQLYQEGTSIFRRNGMEDHAIYCKNNMLVQQFYSDHVTPEEFRALQVEAINNVPGMVGMSHIYNNVGVAYLYCGQPDIPHGSGLKYQAAGSLSIRGLINLPLNLVFQPHKFLCGLVFSGCL